MSKNSKHDLKCPHCGENIEISDLLATRIRNEIKQDFENDRDQALIRQKQARSLEQKQQQVEIELQRCLDAEKNVLSTSIRE